MGKVVLISGGDRKLNQFISDSLHRFNFKTSQCSTPDDTLHKLKTEKFDLIILDKMTDEADGLGLYETIKEGNNIPALILTDKKIKGDFYLSKPVKPGKLLTKIKIILKKNDPEFKFSKSLHVGNLFVDLDKKTAYVKENDLKLTPSEFELILLFTKNNGQALSRDYIIKNLKGISPHLNERLVDVLVSRLRSKLNKAGDENYAIRTIHSIGYMFFDKNKK